MNRVIDGVDLDGLEFYAVNRESQEKVMQFIAHQFGSTAEFSWSDNGRLKYEPAVQQQEALSIRALLFEEFIQVVNGSLPVAYAGDAQNGLMYSFNLPPDGSRPLMNESLPLDPGVEGMTYTGGVPRVAYVLQDPFLSDDGQFELIGGELSSPCASCVFLHELLDHVLPFRKTGSPDQVGQTTADLVKRHSDALNNVGIEGRRSGARHANFPGLPPPGTDPMPRPSGDGQGGGGNQGGGESGNETQPSGGGSNGTPEPRPE